VPPSLTFARHAFTRYQKEVEHLTTRSKAAESEFLKLYKSLREVVDPCQLVQHLRDDHDRVTRSLEDMTEK